MNMNTALTAPIITTKDNKVTIEIPKTMLEQLLHSLKQQQTVHGQIQVNQLYGAWSNKLVNGLEYERALRDEWN